VLGTARTTGTAQLSASGAGTITTATASGFADWPASGWAHIRTSAPATREIVYYSSRTATSLTVPATGRALLGTSAAAGSATDTVTPVAPIRLWLETPTAGEVQTIANHTTAPTGATWSTSETVATLAAGEERALWIHRDVPASATVSLAQVSGLDISYTYSATAYTPKPRAYFRIGDTTLEQYELYVGDGVAPNFATTPAAASATLPFDYALAPDSTYNYAVRYRNRYNLTSFNVLTEQRIIDAGGVDITSALTNPSDITMTSQPGGEVDITLTYVGGNDATVADTWRFYVTTDGTNPDPVNDTPEDTSMLVTNLGPTTITQTITLGPYDYGTTVKVIARTYSSTLLDESNSTTITSHTVTTQNPIQAHWQSMRGIHRPAYSKTTTFGAASIETRNGETIVYGGSEVFRGVIGNESVFRTAFEFYNVAHSASGTASPIEAVSANEVYINVAGTRRAKLDLTNGRIEAATFDFTETAIALPVIGPTHTETAATYIMLLDGITGRWTPIIKVDSSGTFTATRAVLQEN
jgi:hypothetical protein